MRHPLICLLLICLTLFFLILLVCLEIRNLIIFSQRFVKESSRWLITKGRIDEAIEILEHVAKENGKNVDPELMKSYKKTATEEYKTAISSSLSVFDLFKTPVLR